MEMDGGPTQLEDRPEGAQVLHDSQGRRQAFKRVDGAPRISDYTDLFIGPDPVLLPDRPWFCALIGAEVLINTLVLGLEADLKCRHNCDGISDGFWQAMDHLFTVVAVADVAVAMGCLGPRTYFLGEQKPPPIQISGHVRDLGLQEHQQVSVDMFRAADFTMVLLRVLGVWVLGPAGVAAAQGLKCVSAFRVMHLGRFAQQVRLIGTFRELWLVLAGMKDTLKTVVWVAALLLLVLWVFAVVVTIVLSGSDATFNYSSSTWGKDDYWGSVPKSLFSLFQVLTRDRWSDTVVWPLVEADTVLVLIFIVFLCIASLALLNTIVGAVVESTLRSARENEEKDQRERQKLDQKIMASLEQIFDEADTDKSGDLDQEELNSVLKKPRVRKSMNALGMHVGDLNMLFSLLDEGTGKIRTDMFFRGCTRLRGPAMARDLQTVALDLDRHLQTASKEVNMVQRTNDGIAAILDMIDAIDTDIVKDERDEKDPVLQARRGRAKGSRAAYLRGTHAEGEEEREYSKSSTSSIPRIHVGGSGGLRSTARAGGAGGSGGPGGRGVQFQPPPPPLPPHLAHLSPGGNRR